MSYVFSGQIRRRTCLGRFFSKHPFAAIVVLGFVLHHADGGAFVSIRRFMTSRSLHAEADDARIAVPTPSKVAEIEKPDVSEFHQESPEKVSEGPWQMAQAALRDLLDASEAQKQRVANASASGDLAAAGAVLTFAIASEVPALKMATLTEDVVRTLSSVQLAAVEDVMTAASSATLSEGLPAIISSLLLAAAVAVIKVPGEAESFDGPPDWLQALNATVQEVWESGTGSLNTRAATLLKEVARLWAAVDEQLSPKVAVTHESSTESSHGIALCCGSARRQGKDWILPIEVQLFRRNEGRHAVLLGMGRQLFRSLHDMTENDFDEDAMKIYEERARLIFRSFQLPLSNDRALQRLEVRLGGGAHGDDEGWKQLPPTDGNGLIQANVRFTDDNIQLADRFMEQVPVEVRLAEAVQSSETQRLVAPPVTAVAALVRPHGIGVISDIDDTVKVTEVFHGIKAVLQNTFLKTFDDVPGMAKLYQGLEKLDASFHYVSKSPPELHAPLADLLHEKGFPVSSIHLCPLLGRNRANFKLGQVESLLSQFPDRKFILVGDSGEKDPEVYAEIMRRHPKQVLKVLIRSVAPSDEENVAKARAAFQGINVSKWQVFADPREVTLESLGTFAWPKWMPWSSLSNEGMMQVPGQRNWDSMAIPLAGVVVD